MVKFSLLVLIVFSAILFANSTVYGANVASPTKRSKSTKLLKPASVAPSIPTVGLALSKEFDDSLTTLPSHYVGHNIEQLFESIYARRSQFAKDKFETKQAFVERMDGVASTIGPQQIAVGSRIWGLGTRYDAEKQEFSLGEVLLWQFLNNTLASTYAFSVQEKNGPSRKYVAENGYGKKVVVQEDNKTRWAIGLDMSYLRNADPAFTVIKGYDDKLLGAINLKLKMAPDMARQVEGDLALLFVGSVAYPFADKSDREKEATISNPLAINFEYRIVSMVLRQMWLYNLATGEVYQRIVIKDIPNMRQGADN